MNRVKSVPVIRVKGITKVEFIKNYRNPVIAVLVEGLTKDWPAYEKWNFAYVQKSAGDQVVPLFNNESAKGTESVYAPVKEMKLYDYIELLKTEPTDLRIFFYNILDRMPHLLKDFEYPDIGLKFFKRLPSLFFGGGRSRVFMHYDIDLPDSMHFHFQGKKSVLLFSQAQSKYLYQVPFSIHNIDKIDMDDPDFEKYPALQYAEGTQVDMEHGDALYMPSGYWHYIKYLNGGLPMTLRALPPTIKGFTNMLYNVLIMRNFDNLMRKYRGQKWLDYKERLCMERPEKMLKGMH